MNFQLDFDSYLRSGEVQIQISAENGSLDLSFSLKMERMSRLHNQLLEAFLGGEKVAAQLWGQQFYVVLGAVNHSSFFNPNVNEVEISGHMIGPMQPFMVDA